MIQGSNAKYALTKSLPCSITTTTAVPSDSGGKPSELFHLHWFYAVHTECGCVCCTQSVSDLPTSHSLRLRQVSPRPAERTHFSAHCQTIADGRWPMAINAAEPNGTDVMHRERDKEAKRHFHDIQVISFNSQSAVKGPRPTRL